MNLETYLREIEARLNGEFISKEEMDYTHLECEETKTVSPYHIRSLIDVCRIQNKALISTMQNIMLPHQTSEKSDLDMLCNSSINIIQEALAKAKELMGDSVS